MERAETAVFGVSYRNATERRLCTIKHLYTRTTLDPLIVPIYIYIYE